MSTHAGSPGGTTTSRGGAGRDAGAAGRAEGAWAAGGPWGGAGARAPFPGTEGIDVAAVFARPGYTAPHVGADPVCVAALVAVLLSLVPGVGLVAVGLGAWGLRRLRTRYAVGESMAWAGVVVGTVSCVCWLWAGWLLSASL